MEDALRVREEEGIQRGEQRGLQRGRQEGRQEKEREILKLFDTGYSAEEIRERLKASGSRFNHN
jgi:predicted transposase YdaD